uniref:Uncharacterized protein n=1 Tax=Acrobeloides nanus TaxID=290746 RepID=A0A914CRU8_9BILA
MKLASILFFAIFVALVAFPSGNWGYFYPQTAECTAADGVCRIPSSALCTPSAYYNIAGICTQNWLR